MNEWLLCKKWIGKKVKYILPFAAGSGEVIGVKYQGSIFYLEIFVKSVGHSALIQPKYAVEI